MTRVALVPPAEVAALAPQVFLRKPTERDLARLLALNRENQAFHAPWAFPPLSEGELREYLDRCAADDFEGLLICLPARTESARTPNHPNKPQTQGQDLPPVADAAMNRTLCEDVIVGVANLSQIFYRAFQNAYLGYHAYAAAAGRGLMTEGLRLVLHHAFRTLGLHRVEANLQPGNGASRRLVQRLGFTREGFSRRYLKLDGAWRDHERWALLAEDWSLPALPARPRREAGECPQCGRQSLVGGVSLELPPDARSDEITLQALSCPACGCQAVSVYEESRRGALGQDSWDQFTLPLHQAAAQAVFTLLAACPQPADRWCVCPAHQVLGTRDANGRWTALAAFAPRPAATVGRDES